MPVGKYNLPVMNRVMAAIEADEASHNQQVYGTATVSLESFEKLSGAENYYWGMEVEVSDQVEMCRTAFCFAGHATRDAGYASVWSVEYVGKHSVKLYMDYVIHPTRGQVSVAEAAADILGLYGPELKEMFTASRTVAELRAMVDAANAGESVIIGLRDYTLAHADRVVLEDSAVL